LFVTQYYDQLVDLLGAEKLDQTEKEYVSLADKRAEILFGYKKP